MLITVVKRFEAMLIAVEGKCLLMKLKLEEIIREVEARCFSR